MPKQGDFAGGWLPIESAPMDGTDILAAAPCRMAVIWWGDLNGDDFGEPEHVPVFAWLFYDGKNQPMHYRGWPNLTHWMPLPEPPK